MQVLSALYPFYPPLALRVCGLLSILDLDSDPPPRLASSTTDATPTPRILHIHNLCCFPATPCQSAPKLIIHPSSVLAFISHLFFPSAYYDMSSPSFFFLSPCLYYPPFFLPL